MTNDRSLITDPVFFRFIVRAAHFSFCIVLINILLSFPISSHCQNLEKRDKTVVEILNSDLLKLTEKDGVAYRKLIGNVRLKQENTLMYCDSALLNRDENKVDAFGNVRIKQGDSIDIYADLLKYDGNKEIAALYENVKLTDQDLELYTDELFYNMETRVAYYFKGAEIIDDATELTSIRGYYYTSTDDVFFKDSVVITDPNYKLNSDTLKYNTETKMAYFFGKTEIFNENSKIYCDNGWYDTQADIASFGLNTTIDNPPQLLKSDSLYYDRKNGFGKAMNKFLWYDEDMDMSIEGSYGEYYEENSFITAPDRPLLTYYIEKDTLYLSADTLKSLRIRQDDGADDIRYFYAHYKVRIFKDDLQGLCDSMYYSFTDSIFRMYYDPVLWSDETQLTGDTIHITLHDNKIDQINLYSNSFIVSQSAGELYDQVKGKYITGYFKETELEKMRVDGNAESIYFGKDDEDAYIGMNKSLSSSMWIYFYEKKVNKIVFIKQPEAIFTPMRKIDKSEMLLKGFKWLEEKRPNSKESLLED